MTVSDTPPRVGSMQLPQRRARGGGEGVGSQSSLDIYGLVMTRHIDAVHREAAEAILEKLPQRRIHRAHLRVGRNQRRDRYECEHDAGARGGEQAARRRQKAEQEKERRQPVGRRDRRRVKEDAGSDAGGRGDGEQE